ncbi:MAG: serine O-acetyltransferase [Myxococcales bacterium]
MIVSDLLSDLRELALVTKGERGTVAVLRQLLRNDSFPILLLNRLRASARALHIPVVNHALRFVQTTIYGTEIGSEVRLGHGVWFVHPVGTVVGGDARVGDRVRFYGHNAVGTARDNGYPVIEDDVSVGIGACILGPVHIGRGAVIAANAVVLSDVPAGALAAGVPATVRRSNGSERDRSHVRASGAGGETPRRAG